MGNDRFRLELVAYSRLFAAVLVPLPWFRALEAADGEVPADQILRSLEEFQPEECGLPPFESWVSVPSECCCSSV